MATPTMESDSDTPVMIPTSENSSGPTSHTDLRTTAGAGGVVTEKVDEAWKVSSIPEPKQYFSLDVS